MDANPTLEKKPSNPTTTEDGPATTDIFIRLYDEEDKDYCFLVFIDGKFV